MNKTKTLLGFTLLWSAGTILVLTWGSRFDWPDFVHVRYGLPIVWATHTLSTITGPADIWHVNVLALLIDLPFWLMLMVVGMALLIRVKR